MKIESKGVEITEIPVFNSITVTPETITLFGGDGIDSTDEPMVHHLFRKEALALRDALNAALDAQDEMPSADLPPALATLGVRVFERGSDEPAADVTKLIDRGGDVWRRVHGGWCVDSSYEVEPWSYVLNFVPLTEVR